MAIFKKSIQFGSGIIIAQLITAIGIPILSRLYTPEDFSSFGVYFSIASILVVFATLRLETTLPKEENMASQLPTVININLITAGPLLFISCCTLASIEEVFNLHILLMSILVVVATITFNLFNTINILNVRENQVNITNKARVVRSISSLILQITFTALKNGLFIGEVIARLIGVIVLSKKSYYQLRVKEALQLIIDKVHYIKYVVTSGLLNSMGVNLYPILVLKYYDPVLVGKYFFVHKILTAPITIVAQSISVVILGDFNTIINRDKNKLINKMHRLCLLFIVGSLILFICIGFIFKTFETLLFGSVWTNINTFVFILIPLLVGQIAFSPFSQMLILVKGEREQLYWDTGRMLSIVIAVGLPIYFDTEKPFIYSLLLYSVLNFIQYIIHYILLIQAIKRYNYD